MVAVFASCALLAGLVCVGRPLFLCCCGSAVVARLVIPPWGGCVAGARIGDLAVPVPRLTVACVELMCPSWEQTVRLLTGASIFVDIRNGSASLYALDNNSSTRGSGD